MSSGGGTDDSAAQLFSFSLLLFLKSSKREVLLGCNYSNNEFLQKGSKASPCHGAAEGVSVPNISVAFNSFSLKLALSDQSPNSILIIIFPNFGHIFV